jgi:transcription antitermination protein NusB
MKSSRRLAREDALKILFQFEWDSDLTVETALAQFEICFRQSDTPVSEFAQSLVRGVATHRRQIDDAIKMISAHWRPERMTAVDRNVLRLGAYELMFLDDIPSTVTINEMVELARTFGTENSPSFINGVLDKLKNHHPRPQKAP